jgi:hypothetical protein
MTERMVPATGDAWVEHSTEYVIEIQRGGRWLGDDVLDYAAEVSDARKDLIDDDTPEAEIRVVEVLKIHRVMLPAELEARAERERAAR